MKFGTKKFLSLFLLSTFLFAFSVKGLHDILHAGDDHCHALTEKHYHSQEHHCGICDFEFAWFDKAATPARISCFYQYNELTFLSPDKNISVKEISIRSSRAPPVA